MQAAAGGMRADVKAARDGGGAGGGSGSKIY